ncbi:hypothetical protein, partial [Faecalicatena fissicatena]|uniref:hypothetical protein n=1 Tax=Faecalicatena fissicatena TaxID=290055 RepID=UPI001A9B2FDF
YILPTTGRIRDFNPLETCAARRTLQNAQFTISYELCISFLFNITFSQFFKQEVISDYLLENTQLQRCQIQEHLEPV